MVFSLCSCAPGDSAETFLCLQLHITTSSPVGHRKWIKMSDTKVKVAVRVRPMNRRGESGAQPSFQAFSHLLDGEKCWELGVKCVSCCCCCCIPQTHGAGGAEHKNLSALSNACLTRLTAQCAAHCVLLRNLHNFSLSVCMCRD